MNYQKYLAVLTVCFTAMWCQTALAHPAHVSIAEAELNAETGRLEVALRVHPVDLERALQLRNKKRINLDKTNEVDALITAYLSDVFQVKRADGTAAKINWVGKEISLKWGWLYFEVPMKEGLEKARFSNRIFFELLEDQTNMILLKQGKSKTTLQFTHEEVWQSLP